MKTDDLIDMLSSGPDAIKPPRAAHATRLALLAGLLGSVAVMLMLLGVRSNLLEELSWAAFWSKLLFSLALAAAGWLAVKRLSTPGASTGRLPLFLGAPILLAWCGAAVLLANAAPELRAELFWGRTWRYCPVLIAVIALPIFAAVLHVMRQRAPTRLRLAGGAAGFAAGATAAAVYCLHCPELSIAFVGFWYLLGILIPTALGALVGPRVLAW